MSWVTNTTVLRTSRVEAEELVLEPRAGDGVDGAERLVHQEDGGIGGQGPGHADPLALAARHLRRIPAAVDVGREPHQLEQLVDPRRDAFLLPAEEARDGADVRGDRLVREEPGLLDHVTHAPAQLDRVGVGDVVAVEEDPSRRRLDEPVDHLQRRRLAAT